MATNKNFVVKQGIDVNTTANVVGAATLANTLSVTGAATLANTLSVTGFANIGGTLSATGAATLSNTLSVTGFANIGGTLSVAGATALNGTIALGDAFADNISINGGVNTNVIPVAGNNYTLGNTSNRWGAIYGTNGFYANQMDVQGALTAYGTFQAIAWVRLGDASSDILTINSSVNTNIVPVTGNSYSIGNTTQRWAAVWANNITATTNVDAQGITARDLTLTGNLTVSGTVTTINTTDLNVGDAVITLNADLGVGTPPTEDAGFTINRGSAANVSLLWDETNDRWKVASNIIFDSTSTTTGAAIFSNTVSITGAANTLSTLGVAGAATFSNTVSITGAANALSTFGISGAATFSNTVLITGAANALSTFGISGAANALSTLGVAGLATLNGGATIIGIANASTGVNVGANVNLSTSSITVGNSTVNSYLTSSAIETDGTLAVLGATTLSNTLSVTGLSTLANSINITGTANATVGVNVGANVVLITSRVTVGNSTVNSYLTSSAIETDGTLAVLGATTLSNTVSAAGLASLNAGLNTTTANASTGVNIGANVVLTTTSITVGNSTVNTYINNGINTDGTLTVLGASALGNNLTVTGTTNTSVALNVGADVNLTTSRITVGNSTINSFITATGIETDGTITANGVVISDLTARFGEYIVAVSSGIYPSVNATYNIGNSSLMWNTVYTNQLNAGSGNTSTPGLRFFSDTNTGLYNPYGGGLAITTNGITRVIANGTYAVYANGDIYATGDVISASDINVKRNINTVQNGLKLINNLRGVSYNLISTGEKSMGVIAQEVEAILPELVDDSTGTLSVKYNGLIAVLIEAVKDLSTQVETLKTMVNASKTGE